MAMTATGRDLRLPAVLMRGGTSRGPFLLERDLPADPAARERVLLAAMGSPDPLQLDGVGGGFSLTSKVAIVAPSARPGVDVEYLFAQIAVDRPLVDTGPNCGNMLSAVGPFAIEAGLVAARDGQTTVRIYNRNTGGRIDTVVQTPGGVVTYQGTTRIDGAPGAAAPVLLTFLDAAGAKTGALFPTGARREEIAGVAVTLIDYATPMMLVPAAAFGLTGAESPDALDADRALFARIEAMRLEAGRRMGLGDVRDRVTPKVALLGPPRTADGALVSRYLTPHRTHRSHAVTGALCVAVAARTEGTVAAPLARPATGPVVIEHPGGRIDVALETDAVGAVRRASLIRTARRIFEGWLFIPAAAFGPADHPHETRSEDPALTAATETITEEIP